jgi:hypothetical protein
MELSEDQIRELMTTVACASCGAHYDRGGVEVLGHRDGLWFLRVTCAGCASNGLVAAMVKTAENGAALPEAPEPEPIDDGLDRARAPGPVTPADVAGMRHFLSSFDGDFQALFGAGPDARSHRPAA